MAGLPFEEGRQIHNAGSLKLALQKLGHGKVSVAPVPYSHHDLVDSVLPDEGAQGVAVAKQLRLVSPRLLVTAQYEADQMKSCAGTEAAQQRFNLRRPGSAPEHENATLQRFAADKPEEHRPCQHREDKRKQKAQGHDAAPEEARRYDIEDDHHRQGPGGVARKEAHLVLAVIPV